MSLKNLFLIALVLVAPFSVTHAKFKCDGELIDYAKELIEVELAGSRGPQKGQCLKQSKFKYVRAVHNPDSEIAGQSFYYANPKTLVINDVKKIHEDKNHYRVEFTIQAGKDPSSLKTKSDSLVFFHNAQENWGCAHLLFAPEDIYIAPHCL